MSDVAESSDDFAGLRLCAELQRVLGELGYEEPTPIQREAIPVLLQGRDVLGQAATGTGKTAAFALPLLQRVMVTGRDREVRALVLVPTRELAVQVSEAIHRYGTHLGARVVPIYGGQPIVRQLRALEHGVDVVVATPGRALDHIARGTLRMAGVETVVLDEADEMLDMGFAEDIEAILDATPPTRQTVLFSATTPPRIDAMIRRYLRDPVRIELGRKPTSDEDAARVRQSAYLVPRAHKAAALGRVLDVEAPAAAIVFCRTRDEVDQLTETLNGRGYRAEALHGGLEQAQRDRVMGRLRSGTTEVLVATDVAARGLDVDQLTHVINYDVPSSPDTYVHRIGRVGRAGRDGVAISLVEPREHRLLQSIERVTKHKIGFEKLPTLADLRNRRLDLTRASLREILLADDIEHFRVVVESLAEEFDVMNVALAAVKLAHEATEGADHEEIPEVTPTAAGGTRGRPSEGRPRTRTPGRPMTRLFIGAGRNIGVRPKDLVGAITGESRLSGGDIGVIEIAERFSFVEVPDAAVDEVVTALRRTTIKGRKPKIDREFERSNDAPRPRR